MVLTAPTEPASLHDLIAAAGQGEGLVLSVASTADALAVSTVHAELRSSWATDAVLLGAEVLTHLAHHNRASASPFPGH